MTDASVQAWIDVFATEDLDPELEAASYVNDLGWLVIHHPLVISIMHVPQLNKTMNTSLRVKREMIDEARAKRNWSTYIFGHERPYRRQAFERVADEMTDFEFWHHLRTVWVDSENIPSEQVEWDELLRTERPRREAMMHCNERQALRAMPDRLTVWQGHTSKRDDGWSWTLSREKAVWFARRFATLEGGQPRLSTAVVDRSVILAYFTSRNEEEVLISPTDVVRRRVAINSKEKKK